MRTLDSIAAHPRVWRVDWFDKDDMLVQTIMVENELDYLRYLRRIEIDRLMLIMEGGRNAEFIRILQLAGGRKVADGDGVDGAWARK